jgi:hypothetical protein
MTEFISVMAADSKHFTRGPSIKPFKGVMGVCISSSNPDEFSIKYHEIIQSIYEPITVSKTRQVLKSFDISQYYRDDRDGFLASLTEFARKTSECGITANFVFTTFNTQKFPQGVKIYGYKSPHEFIQPLIFLDKLSSYYSYIATWKTSKFAQLRNCRVFLDNFTGENTSAWGELCVHHDVCIIPNGDLCNIFISTADLLTRYIDEYLSQNRLHLEEASVIKAFENCGFNKYHIFYVGHQDIDQIVPLDKRQINYVDYYPKPMIYLVKEGILDSENDYIERSPSWNILLNYASKLNAGIKYVNYNEDFKYIQEGDIFIYFGERGETKAKYLKTLGYKITPKSIVEIS